MNLKRKSIGSSLIVAGIVLSGILYAQVVKTPAETADFQQRGTLYQPMMDFIYGLASRTDLMQVQKLTQTLLGRDVVLCILSDPPVYQPSDAFNSNKPVVLIVNNVHGGEYAGKDATLALMRDLTQGELKPLLKKTVVLIVPTINPDGAETFRRTNEQQFDLNRDYIKLESQEINALVTRVLNKWQPDIHVDTHHGGAAPYTLTFQTCLNPSCDQNLVALGNNQIIPRIRSALRKEDYDGFWYSGPGRLGGQEGWTPTSCEPRKQHTYAGLNNSVGFLFETPGSTHRVIKNGTEVVAVPANERYRHQVRGQYLGQREVIRFAAEQGDLLRKVVNQARETAVRLGSDDLDNDTIVLEYKQESKGEEEFWSPKAATTPAPPQARGAAPPAPQGRGAGPDRQYEKVSRPIFTKFTATRTTTRPWGYILPPSLATVVPILLDHQIAVKKLTEPVEVEVEVYSTSEVQNKEYFQGHYLKAAKVTKRTEKMKFPAGAFVVPAGQPKANLISYILEPETDDNLLTWNFLDNYVQVTGQSAVRTAEEEAPARPARQMQIPIYRIPKKAEMKTVLVEEYNVFQRNRFVR
jgi:hypothetical protein